MKEFSTNNTAPEDLARPEASTTGNRFEICQQIADLIDTILIEPSPDRVHPEIVDALENKNCALTGIFMYYNQTSGGDDTKPIKNLLIAKHTWNPYADIREYSVALDITRGDPQYEGLSIRNQYGLFLPPKRRQTTELIERDAVIKYRNSTNTITGEPQKDYPVTQRGEEELLEQIEAFAINRAAGRLMVVGLTRQYSKVHQPNKQRFSFIQKLFGRRYTQLVTNQRFGQF